MVDIFNSPHNAIMDILISWGLLGLILISYTCWTMALHGAKNVNKKNRLLAFLPAMVSFVAVMAGQYLTTAYPHMHLCFLLLAVKAFAATSDSEKAKEIAE